MNKIETTLGIVSSLILCTLSGCATTSNEAATKDVPRTAQLQSGSDATQQARTVAEVEKRSRMKDFWFP
jgi:hypothetical protein